MNAETTIVLVEDDESIAEPLIFGLTREGYRVLHATDGRVGLDLARQASPDVVVLDVMLPGLDGFAVCRALRRDFLAVPILMLTARGQELDRVMGLELGADDYIVKPFSFRELVARVRAVLRRRVLDSHPASPPSDRSLGPLTLDRLARQAWLKNQPVELTPREFDLLRVLVEHAGQALRRQELLDRVWGAEWIGDPRTLDVHIRWLREKLEDDPSHPHLIQTVRGFGYRFMDRPADPTTPALAS